MQISSLIVSIVAVNVMDYVARLRVNDLAMFPLSAAPFFPVSQAERRKRLRVVPVTLFGRRARGLGGRKFCDRADHFITATNMSTVRHCLALALVRIQRVAMLSRHLIVTIAHIQRDGRARAMQASSPDNLPSPSVFRRAVALDALVVHQAKAVCGVLSSTTVNRAKRHKRSRSWLSVYGIWQVFNQALGNSWAVPVVAWIAGRVDRALSTETA